MGGTCKNVINLHVGFTCVICMCTWRLGIHAPVSNEQEHICKHAAGIPICMVQ